MGLRMLLRQTVLSRDPIDLDAAVKIAEREEMILTLTSGNGIGPEERSRKGICL